MATRKTGSKVLSSFLLQNASVSQTQKHIWTSMGDKLDFPNKSLQKPTIKTNESDTIYMQLTDRLTTVSLPLATCGLGIIRQLVNMSRK